MPDNEREVFDYITSDRDTSSEEDLLTYAMFAFERREWFAQFEKKHGAAPSPQDIDRWVSELSEWQFAQMRSHAAGIFDGAAREYLKHDLEAARKEGAEAAIISEVRAATGGFWRQVGLALATAILAPLIIGAMIVFGQNYSKWFPTPSDVSAGMQKGSSEPGASDAGGQRAPETSPPSR